MEEVSGHDGSSYEIVLQMETLLNKLKINTKNEAVQNVSSACSIEVSHEKGEDDDYLQLLLKCSCLKHITNLLDDVFEIDLSNTKLNCIYCNKEPTTIAIGTFDITNIEYEKQPIKSPKFKNLVASLKRHLKLETHIQNVNHECMELKKRSEKNKEVGRRIGSLSYYIYYKDIPLNFFGEFLPWFTLNNIDIGEVNHSRTFIKHFINSVYDVVCQRLIKFLDQELPCTGKPSPVAILVDKSTHKHDTKQPTLIRTVALKKGNIFSIFFIDHPIVLDGSGLGCTILFLESMYTKLNWSPSKLRLRFCGGAVDGQYIHNNVHRHTAHGLSLNEDFTSQAIQWDSAHNM